MVAIAALALLLDFGTPASPVHEGWTALTPQTLAAEGAAGWVDPDAMEAQDKAWPREVENASAHRTDPPPVYTNELIQDAIEGAGPATLRLPLAPGDYELWFAAGDSTGRRGQVWDFTLSVGGASEHVQISRAYWFETRRLRFHADGPIDVQLATPSRWILSALAVYPVDQAEAMAAQLEPIETGIYLLPPDILETWKELVHEDPMGEMPAIPAAARERGYLVHHRHYLENVYHNTVPYASSFDPTLEAFASRGEREPLTFSIYALQPLADCRVSVGPLTGPGAIPAERIDVKMVQYAYSKPNYRVFGTYHLVPDYLRPFETVDLPADRNQRFWLTVQVPDDAAPGIYTGEATFTPAGAAPATVPIRLRVLPIALQEDPSKTYGMYYRDPLEEANRARDDFSREYFERQAEHEGEDMNAHGTVMNVPLSLWVSVPTDKAQPIEWSADWDLLQRRIERCRKYGYDGPFVISINDEGLFQRHTGERYGSHLSGAHPAPDPFSAELQAMVEFIETGRKERGLPEFLYYPVDEPGRDPDAVAYMSQCLQAIQAGGGKTYVTADPAAAAFEPMAPYVNVWSTQPFLPDYETIKADMAARDVEYWCYPNHVNGENDHTVVAGARMTYGFGFWRSGFVTLNPWIYSYTQAHPFNNLDGTAQDFFNRPGPDSTIWPVPMWEAYREGYDDMRYLYTLQQTIDRARAAGKTAEADRAAAVLQGIWDAIDVKAKYKLDEDVWGYQTFDLYRWQLAEQILALQAALGN